MNNEALASKAADAVGVTPHSDMRLFVEQAVKWALKEAALSTAEPVATVAEMGAGGMRVLMPHPPGSTDHLPIGTKLYAAPPALSAQAQDVAGWQSMDSAPKDGTILRLLVNPDQEEFTAFDDSLTPFETIGFNNLENTKEDRWEFAGWDWQQDCFITGRGEVIAWAIFDAPPSNVGGYEDSQSAKLWPGQNAGTVIKEMQDIATGDYDGYEDAYDPWTADNRADIDRWQSIISAILPAAPAKQEG